MDPNSVSSSNSAEIIFDDFKRRQAGIIKALTTEFDEFYKQCDPEKENLCLYGLSNGRWEVGLPAEDVPPELPEPALGINFSRDGMLRQDWLTLIALHSDAWLLALVSFYGAELSRTERKRLHTMVSDLPTAYDIITGRDADEDLSSVDQISNTNNSREENEDEGKGTSSNSIHMTGSHTSNPQEKKAVSNAAGTSERGKSESCADTSMKQVVPKLSKPLGTPATPRKRKEQVPQTCPDPRENKKHMSQVTAPSEPSRLDIDAPSETHAADTSLQTIPVAPTMATKPAQGNPAQSVPEPDEIDEDTPDEHEDALCDICRGQTAGDDDISFWVGCDCCDKWFHCKCVNITPAKAEYIKHYKCPECTSKKAVIKVDERDALYYWDSP